MHVCTQASTHTCVLHICVLVFEPQLLEDLIPGHFLFWAPVSERIKKLAEEVACKPFWINNNPVA